MRRGPTADNDQNRVAAESAVGGRHWTRTSRSCMSSIAVGALCSEDGSTSKIGTVTGYIWPRPSVIRHGHADRDASRSLAGKSPVSGQRGAGPSLQRCLVTGEGFQTMLVQTPVRVNMTCVTPLGEAVASMA